MNLNEGQIDQKPTTKRHARCDIHTRIKELAKHKLYTERKMCSKESHKNHKVNK